MTAKTRVPTNCWFCGYDLAGVPDPLCPECGNDPTKAPPLHRVRHGGAVMFSIFGFLLLASLGFVLVLDLGAPSGLLPGVRSSWTKVAWVGLLAVIQAALGVRMMVWPPQATHERSTAPVAMWVAAGLCAGAVVVMITG